jgi:hypothetical protein
MNAHEIIAKALCDSNPSNTQRYDDCRSDRQALWLHRAGAAVDALTDHGFAVVKLSEPDDGGYFCDLFVAPNDSPRQVEQSGLTFDLTNERWIYDTARKVRMTPAAAWAYGVAFLGAAKAASRGELS